MARKPRMNITLSPENEKWIRQLTQTAGIPISLFVDSLLTGARVSTKEGMTDREALSAAFEQLAEGVRK